ncbi:MULTISPECIES: aspartate/glutamate racemase family protein [unclassified Robiginitalea]|uniref:aspartate/glutamate racemase family protein n=1 Tax=Robiginitalea TaxID=252306 RepID=UPI00234A2F95|nr:MULTISPECIES: amino acid racemase [unclassified Robiginitalea]MDC6355628.1 amino acid racemase [Robiginitalea sp. PM2]MDC6376039.1 amino acid racemase [Robiginitalea sp. SP8]
MRTLGLIGGTSWHSTIEYYRCINEQVGRKIGRHANPPLILHSINIELMREQDPRKINAKYLDVAQKLEQAGAGAIVICANTPHMAYEYVQPKIGIPFLHIADATGREAERLGLKKLGLLGNRPTMTGDFISGYLRSKYRMETLIPEARYIGQAHDYVSKELTQGEFSNRARIFFLTQIELLRARGAEGIILGCTELPLLLKEDDIDIPLLATTHLHIGMAVAFILAE